MEKRFNKKIMILVSIVIVIAIIICCILKIVNENNYKNSFINYMDDSLQGYQYYDNKVEVIDFMKANRKVVIYMTNEFDNLSRLQKHTYMEGDFGQKIKKAFNEWMSDGDKYHKFEINDLTFMDIAIILKHGDNVYQYGVYYTTPKGYTDLKYSFIDKDGTLYDFIDEADHAAKNEAWIEGQRINEEVRNELAEKDKEKSQTLDVTDDKEKAICWSLAKDVISEHLKSPSTAKFPLYTNEDIKYTYSNDIYTVYGYVDAQNSFGATVRTEFYVTMKKSGTKFTAQSYQIIE